MHSPENPQNRQTGLWPLAAGICLALVGFAVLAQDSTLVSTGVDANKTNLEIAKLEWETGIGRYVPIATPILVVVAGAALAAWFDRRLKAAELRFTELTSARQKAYAEAFCHLKPTALFSRRLRAPQPAPMQIPDAIS